MPSGDRALYVRHLQPSRPSAVEPPEHLVADQRCGDTYHHQYACEAKAEDQDREEAEYHFAAGECSQQDGERPWIGQKAPRDSKPEKDGEFRPSVQVKGNVVSVRQTLAVSVGAALPPVMIVRLGARGFARGCDRRAQSARARPSAGSGAARGRCR